jgi:hypothetical protein
VQSPPLRGGAGQGEVAFGGEREDNAEGGFLGGAHSVRPHCRAVPKPRHDMINGGKRTPEGLAGRSLAPSEASFAGVQSPPFRHGVHGRQTTSRGTSQSPRDAVL